MATTDDEIYDDGVLRVEHGNYYVACRGQRVLMPLKNFLLLSRLAKNAGRLVTAHELWHDVWGSNEALNRDTLRVHIYRLRQKLAPFGITIINMSKVGYCLYAAAAAGERHHEVRVAGDCRQEARLID